MSKIIKLPASSKPQALNPDEVYKNLFEADRDGEYKNVLGNTLEVFIQNIKNTLFDLEFWDCACKTLKMNNHYSDKKCKKTGKPEGKLIKLTFM